MMQSKNKNRRELYATAKQYLDMKALFPKSNGVGRAPLTDYQQRKISKELRSLADSAGGMKFLERDFVKVKRTKGAQAYLEAAGLPKTSRGVLLSGGEKVNQNATIRNGTLFYDRGGRGSAQFPLDASSERNLSKGIRQHSGYIENPENSAYLVTAGGKINNAYFKRRGKYFPTPTEIDGGEDSTEILEELAVTLYERYAAIANAGGMRPREKGGRAVHPSKWGMALVIERR